MATRRRCPPGQVRGHAVDVRPEFDEPEHLLDAAAHLGQRHVAFFIELVADILADGERIEERALLEHHAGLVAHAEQLRLAHLVDAHAVDPDRPRIGCQQSEDELQHGRLARPAGAEEDLGEARVELEADAAQDDVVVEGQVDVLEHHHRLIAGAARGGPAQRVGIDLHQNSSDNSSWVEKKSMAITATEAATTALVVARPTPSVPPRVRRPT